MGNLRFANVSTSAAIRPTLTDYRRRRNGNAHSGRGPLLEIWYNGDFAVRLFFVLSGYVLSLEFLRRGNVEVLRSYALRRYFLP